MKIECACGQCFPLLTARMLGAAGVPPDTKLLDLIRPIKCQVCRSRGRAMVSVEWAVGDDQANSAETRKRLFPALTLDGHRSR
jgi:hypothetical protein